jgi:hypothetical protein
LRERWFGATKQRVPQIAVEGEIDFPSEPLVLDEVDDEKLRAAHEEGTPVVIRADTEEKVVAALARPEVACVLVPDATLLEIDLVKATYG